MKSGLFNKLFFFLPIGILIFCAFACKFENKQIPEYNSAESLERIEMTPEAAKIGSQAVEKFHQLQKESKFDQLFEWIDPKSQLKSDQSAWDFRMNKIADELGQVETSKLSRSSLFNKKNSQEIRLEYITKFSKEREDDERPRHEMFFFEIGSDGKVTLLEYWNGIVNETRY